MTRIFTLAAAVAGSLVVTLDALAAGEAGNDVVVAKSGISTVPSSVITGNLGVSPATAAATLRTGATLDGRLLAQAAVALDTSTIVAPARD